MVTNMEEKMGGGGGCNVSITLQTMIRIFCLWDGSKERSADKWLTFKEKDSTTDFRLLNVYSSVYKLGHKKDTFYINAFIMNKLCYVVPLVLCDGYYHWVWQMYNGMGLHSTICRRVPNIFNNICMCVQPNIIEYLLLNVNPVSTDLCRKWLMAIITYSQSSIVKWCIIHSSFECFNHSNMKRKFINGDTQYITLMITDLCYFLSQA